MRPLASRASLRFPCIPRGFPRASSSGRGCAARAGTARRSRRSAPAPRQSTSSALPASETAWPIAPFNGSLASPSSCVASVHEHARTAVDDDHELPSALPARPSRAARTCARGRPAGFRRAELRRQRLVLKDQPPSASGAPSAATKVSAEDRRDDQQRVERRAASAPASMPSAIRLPARGSTVRPARMHLGELAAPSRLPSV